VRGQQSVFKFAHFSFLAVSQRSFAVAQGGSAGSCGSGDGVGVVRSTEGTAAQQVVARAESGLVAVVGLFGETTGYCSALEQHRIEGGAHEAEIVAATSSAQSVGSVKVAAFNLTKFIHSITKPMS
jgi:hypothetical protein